MLPLQLNNQNPISAQLQSQSLSSGLHMDPTQHIQLQQAAGAGQGGHQGGQQQGPSQSSQPAPKRRKRADGTGEDGAAPAEPRRLRRSHEACARCRSKKIKCDSKHPRCTACTTAGTECNQEDRHRQTLTPRGYTERLELQLAQCEALIKRQIPGFSKENLDDILAREGIDVVGFPPGLDPTRPFRADGGPPPKGPGYPPMYPPPMMGPYPHPPPPMMPYGPHYQLPYGMHPPPPFPPQPPYGPPPGPPLIQPPHEQAMQPAARPASAVKGTDPHGHDMSSAQALAKNFGVSDIITSGLRLDPVHEDLPVNPNALPRLEIPTPRDAAHWLTLSIRREPPTAGPPNTLSLYPPVAKSTSVDVWLPKDRKFAKHIVDVYFARLNYHRPVYARKDFDKILNDLYDGATPVYDPGHLCSVYLIFALGTLSELNHRAVNSNLDAEKHQFLGNPIARKLMPHDWPTHDEFFERALGIKPELRVSITSLQALILLHWFLYIERQGRTLWRLVGDLVRLSVELGLHHDPTTQIIPGSNQPTFVEEESQLRIRLWACVLIHDRGTSILLGRPLAIATSDSNTPQPLRAKNIRFAEFSEHFELSQPVADIQADIINSLYAPTRQGSDTIWRNATRIIKRMTEFRRNLPDKYQYYFTGTQDWGVEKKIQLVVGISEDAGLTLLKIWIARILMLRALFSSKDLGYAQKHKALVDAIITSHNVIIVHNQLIRFPDIAFFTSPIPLHIAAMVILYGHISKVDCLPTQVALEDIWMALDMIPRFRWRWERKDANGGHPLISKLAEYIMGVNLQTVKPSHSHPPVLLCEPDWEEPTSSSSPSQKSQHGTPVMNAISGGYSTNNNNNNAGQGYIQNGPINRSNSGGSTPSERPERQLVDVPQALFFPFFPELGAQVIAATNPGTIPGGGGGAAGSSGSGGGNKQHDYRKVLLAAAAAQDPGYQPPPPPPPPAHETYNMSEEKDGAGAGASGAATAATQQAAAWVTVQNSRSTIEYSP